MPRKDGKVFCLNHPEAEMVVQNEGNERSFHVVRMATLSRWGKIELENKSTGLDVYSCRECGYCEIYLTVAELELLRKK
jgi:heterodisulfide reductase subunit A-like polyferredoxin